MTKQKNKIFILKIGSFMRPEGDTSSIGLITSEPMNFAKVLVDTVGEDFEIILASDKHIVDADNQLTYINIERDGRFFANDMKPGDILLIWQGVYLDQEHHPHITAHYEFINELQRRSDAGTIKQYFMLTDTRVPLLNIVDYVKSKFTPGEFASKYMDDYATDFLCDASRFEIDTEQIVMLTQAYKTVALQKDLEDGLVECNSYYQGFEYKKYKNICHLPMHCMPLITHTVDKSFEYFNSANVPKHDMVFTVQSLGYFNDYRMERFLELVAHPSISANFDVAVYGKHNRKSYDKLFDYVEANDASGHGVVSLPKMLGPVKFDDMKYILNQAQYNMCISEGPYVKYDLLPNRIFESFASGTLLLIDIDIVQTTSQVSFRWLMSANNKFLVGTTDDVVVALNGRSQGEVNGFKNDIQAFMQSALTNFYAELKDYFS
ncbi:hypothetical protein MA9V1_058 [Chryseobacterium phage MA9V-1]|nr:hypothetical protein MA9V1_058 [Chryseobacterium phage MA9V-1]